MFLIKMKQSKPDQLIDQLDRIELTTDVNIPKDTSLYCLIIHDKIFEYIPLTNEIRKIL